MNLKTKKNRRNFFNFFAFFLIRVFIEMKEKKKKKSKRKNGWNSNKICHGRYTSENIQVMITIDHASNRLSFLAFFFLTLLKTQKFVFSCCLWRNSWRFHLMPLVFCVLYFACTWSLFFLSVIFLLSNRRDSNQ